MLLEESQREQAAERLQRWHWRWRRKVMEGASTGAGMDLREEWNGAPVLYHGVPRY